MKKEEEKLVSLKFVYGNTYKKLQKGEYKLNPGGRPLDNSWVGYFWPENPNLKVGDFVEKITWTLHPTFHNPVREEVKAPFELKCPGCWGYFDLPFAVKFKKSIGVPVHHLNFELAFEENGV